MTNERPDTSSVLARLKDFQRQTVDYVFQRMYLDADRTERFLVADEVGLGKTLIARGVIARVIEHLQDRTDRIDIVYVCSNADIARQNINRLRVTGSSDFVLASRLTLLPLEASFQAPGKLNFVSFTPGTSFDLKSHLGTAQERVLLYHLLDVAWGTTGVRAMNVLQGQSGTDSFRRQVNALTRDRINASILKDFVADLRDPKREDLQNRFKELCATFPRAGDQIPEAQRIARAGLVGELRHILAQTCLKALEPDLVILDEFQRFKHLLSDEDTAGELARELFSFQEKQGERDTAVRVLLLSATPYRMYTPSGEETDDDHYADFHKTLEFLLDDPAAEAELRNVLTLYREELLQVAEHGTECLAGIKRRLEDCLRRVMVRTERLAFSADRNGMLLEVAAPQPDVLPSDLEQYLSMQRVARSIGQEDVLEYWKSAPYLMNFMEEYELKRRLKTAFARKGQSPEFVDAIKAAKVTSLRLKDVERYRQIDPGNARLRSLSQDTIGRDAWKLLWIPPALPYYQGRGPFARPELQHFTKRLVFSCWRVVPKAIAAMLSYEAERKMITNFSANARNTAKARAQRRPLLRFATSKGRPIGMPALALTYPAHVLAEHCDPLLLAAPWVAKNKLATRDELVISARNRISGLLQPHLIPYADLPGPVDESWYWVAPLLLDRLYDADKAQAWFARADLEDSWLGTEEHTDDVATNRGWARHVAKARDIIEGRFPLAELGRPPKDLLSWLAVLGVAAPGICAYRALRRATAHGVADEQLDLRSAAAPVGRAFLRLFNLPEVTAWVRDPKRNGQTPTRTDADFTDTPYWKRVLEYCLGGNLQAMLDEYAHILLESEGLIDQPASEIVQALSEKICECLSLRTATTQVDSIRTTSQKAEFGTPMRMRTRFAMRFGDQDAEDGSEPTRADHVRAAFNSPFWPFVLATTSVGQEGLDFHPYCHAVVHWNLPSNPVDLEQREGRVHRYKGHALRKNLATAHRTTTVNNHADPWESVFRAACAARPADQSDLYPFWVTTSGAAKIERHVPVLPHSRDIGQYERLRRALVMYRLVFGQNRQEDLIQYLLEKISEDKLDEVVECCRIDLAPPSILTNTVHATAGSDTCPV